MKATERLRADIDLIFDSIIETELRAHDKAVDVCREFVEYMHIVEKGDRTEEERIAMLREAYNAALEVVRMTERGEAEG